MRYKTNFQKLIDELDEYEWFFDVYAKSCTDLSASTKILIIDDEDEDERDEYDESPYKGYGSLLSIAQLRSVLENLEQGCEVITTVKIIDAVVHYYDNDSFIY